MARAALVVAEREAQAALVLERVEPALGVAAAVVVDLLEPAAAAETRAWINETHVPARASIRKTKNRIG